MQEFILSVDNIDRVVREHLTYLDKQWPEGESAPRKVHIVELIDGIRLKLHLVAKNNLAQHESAFERSARKITNTQKEPRLEEPEALTEAKSEMQVKFEKAREARRGRLGN